MSISNLKFKELIVKVGGLAVGGATLHAWYDQTQTKPGEINIVEKYKECYELERQRLMYLNTLKQQSIQLTIDGVRAQDEVYLAQLVELERRHGLLDNKESSYSVSILKEYADVIAARFDNLKRGNATVSTILSSSNSKDISMTSSTDSALNLSATPNSKDELKLLYLGKSNNLPIISSTDSSSTLSATSNLTNNSPLLIDKPKESNVLGPLNELFTNYKEFLSHLTSEELACLFNSIGFIIIFFCTISLTSVYFGDKLLTRLNLEVRFPKISKYIKLRRQFQNYYLIWNLILIYFITLSWVSVNIFMIFFV